MFVCSTYVYKSDKKKLKLFICAKICTCTELLFYIHVVTQCVTKLYQKYYMSFMWYVCMYVYTHIHTKQLWIWNWVW